MARPRGWICTACPLGPWRAIGGRHTPRLSCRDRRGFLGGFAGQKSAVSSSRPGHDSGLCLDGRPLGNFRRRGEEELSPCSRNSASAALPRSSPLASVALSSIPASAAGKAFQRAELDEAAIKLEAEIKNDAGQAAKPLAQLRREADAAFQKNDVRNGMVLLGQIIAQAPDESASWLRLARAIQQIRVVLDRDRLALHRARRHRRLHRLSARQEPQRGGRRAGDRRPQLRRPPGLAAGARRAPAFARTARGRRRSRALREDARGSRLPPARLYRRCRLGVAARLLPVLRGAAGQARRFLAVRRGCRPGQARAVRRRQAALRRGAEARRALQRDLARRLCRRPSRRRCRSRPTSRSMCATARPMARFAGKAYVLPRTGQRGIPLVSVNTKAVGIDVYRISDRNLIETVLGRDFQRNLYPYEIERLTESRGIKVWNGELAVEQTLNAEITTAFPVDQAIGDMAPGVYVMTATAQGTTSDDFDAMSTQWFIVSDMGLAAYSGNDGINVFVNSLATTEPRAQVEVRLMSRGNEILSTKQTDAAGRIAFEAGLSRGEGALVAGHAGRDRRQGRLRVSQSEGSGVRSERPRRQGPAGGGGPRCLRLHRARRLSLGRDRARHVAAARRARRGRAERAADARGRAAGRHRVSPHRGARSGRRRPFARRADQRGGADRHVARARLHRSEAPGGRRDHLPGRGLCRRSSGVRSCRARRTRFPAARRPS